MTDEQWPRVKALFQSAADRPDSERAAFLAAATDGDEALRREVESLLTWDASGGSVLDRTPPAAMDPTPSHPALAAGIRVGPYEIVAALGAGGMGEVYRARDTKLQRDIAIKVLPESLADDPDRLARFQREAHVLATLNHPNIAAIYGVEESSGMQALVLELVDGPTLADRIALAPIPLEEALTIGRQIAEALEAAHEKGVIHRDIKPANIKTDPKGMVKVLDFGLAKVWDGAPQTDLSGSPRLTATDIAERTIMGTPAYMSPEQARCKPLDRRTDIWSFGCVLYEMLTGRTPFAGDTISDTIAAILDREPDWNALPANVPPAIGRLLKRCLEKDPNHRLRDIGDARIELRDALTPGARITRSNARAMVPPWRRFAPAIATSAFALLLTGGVAVSYLWKSSIPIASSAEYEQITNFTDSVVAPSLSPDGRMVAFIRGGDSFLSAGQIYVKLLPSGESVRLTSGGGRKYGPVFTPDGSRIAYTDVSSSGTSTLWDTWTVPVLGGAPTLFLPNASGLTWIADRRVLFAEIKTGLHMGIVTSTESRAASREIYFPAHLNAMAHYAYASPDRRSVLVVEMDQTHAFRQPCRLLPFDGSSAGRQVGPQGTCTAAAWSPDGQWMYFAAVVGGTSQLWRQDFPDGTPEQITFGPTEAEGIAVAPDGRSLVTSIGMRRSAIWIHDAAGERALSSEGYGEEPRFSQDGKRVFYLVARDWKLSSAGWTAAASELRVVDLASGKTDSVLPGLSVRDYDVSRDEKEVTFTTTEADGLSQIWLAWLDRRAPARPIARGGDQVSFGSGGDLIFRSLDETTNSLVRIRKDGTGREPVTTARIIDKGAVSFDGEWVIAVLPATGESESRDRGVYAVPIRGATPIRICGDCNPSWSSDGRFFYLGSRGGASPTSPGKTLAIPLAAGRSLPDLPASGIDLADGGFSAEGSRVFDQSPVSGPNPSVYVFTKTDLQRNLFRVPLH